MKRVRPLAVAVMAVAASLMLSGAQRQQQPQPSRSVWRFSPSVTGIEVRDRSGNAMTAPFFGGLDLPRPSLVDINGDGKVDLFVQERTGDLMYFERVGDAWTWRSDRFQDLNVGEWHRFVDMDGDGDQDMFSELLSGYIRVWRNVGSKTAPSFAALGDSVRDVDGRAIVADRQNILNVVDIDCNRRLDLFIGRVQGVVDRYEQEGNSPDGTPRFRLMEEKWQGIEVIGPETMGLMGVDTLSRRGPRAAVDGNEIHGANTLAFADVEGKGVLDLYWGDFFEQGLLRFENYGFCAQPDLTGKPERFPPAKPLLTSGYNAPTFGDVDGDGLVDMVVGVIGGAYQPSRTAIDNLYLLRQSPKGVWTETSRRIVSGIDVGSEAAPLLADLNGDSLLDLIVGGKISVDSGSSGTVTWFQNTGTATQPIFQERGALPSNGARDAFGKLPFLAEYNYAPAAADLDGDGLVDLVVGTWRDRIQWYRNTGTRTAPSFALQDSVLVMITRGTNTTPSFGDLDGDGLLDLVIGEASGAINLYRNAGTRTVPRFELVSDQFQDIRVGRRSAPYLADMNRDGKLDMLIGNADGEVQLWLGAGARGEIRFARDESFVLKSYPNAVPIVADLRGRGIWDLVIGVSAGGLRLYDNTAPR